MCSGAAELASIVGWIIFGWFDLRFSLQVWLFVR
jgi:hypothetical protein